MKTEHVNTILDVLADGYHELCSLLEDEGVKLDTRHRRTKPPETGKLGMSDLNELLKLRTERAHADWMADGRYHQPPHARESLLMKLFEELLAPEWAKTDAAPGWPMPPEKTCQCEGNLSMTSPVLNASANLVHPPKLQMHVFRATWKNNAIGTLQEYGEGPYQAATLIHRDNPGVCNLDYLGYAA